MSPKGGLELLAENKMLQRVLCAGGGSLGSLAKQSIQNNCSHAFRPQKNTGALRRKQVSHLEHITLDAPQ